MPYEKEIVDRLAAYCDAGYEIIQIERTLLVAAMDAIYNQYECMHGYTIQDACEPEDEELDSTEEADQQQQLDKFTPPLEDE